MVKIIDCFIFYNELDLLNYRLNILYNIVDYFVIVESTHTFVGKEKVLYFDSNKEQFKQFKDKIIHVIVDDFPYKYPTINISEGQQWANEYHQRDCISRGIQRIEKLDDNDLICISDLDEIIDPATIKDLKEKNDFISINQLEMDIYYYNLNSKFDFKWMNAKVLKYSIYKDFISCGFGLNRIRLEQFNMTSIPRSGWHLSYFGDSKFISNKIKSFSHQEHNFEEYTSEEKINLRLQNGDDLFDRSNKPTQIAISDNNYLPPYFEKYLKKYYR